MLEVISNSNLFVELIDVSDSPRAWIKFGSFERTELNSQTHHFSIFDEIPITQVFDVLELFRTIPLAKTILGMINMKYDGKCKKIY